MLAAGAVKPRGALYTDQYLYSYWNQIHRKLYLDYCSAFQIHCSQTHRRRMKTSHRKMKAGVCAKVIKMFARTQSDTKVKDPYTRNVIKRRAEDDTS